MRSLFFPVLALVMCFSRLALVESSYFKEIEKMFVGEHGRQATNVLQEDLAGGKDHPKLITISYPTVRW
jgi:hypothetical protein